MTLPEETDPWAISPSISADGRIIGSALRVRDGVLASSGRRFTVSTYAMAKNKWTEYPGLELTRGAVSISPDGTELAFVGRIVATGPILFRIVDLKTGKITVGQQPAQSSNNAISWSPDGRRITFSADVQMPGDEPPVPRIFVMDVETGQVAPIASGWGPSWSPSGEWIAYFSYTAHIHNKQDWWSFKGGDRVSRMHPDGSDSVVLHRFKWPMNTKPVWSPDSETLLLTTFADDDGKFDVFALDTSSRKLKKEFRHPPLIFGWVPAN